jgi:hypothetical protein
LAEALDAERYYHPTVGYYEHMPASVVRALCGRGGLAQLFQIRLRPQSMGPAGLLVSLQDEIEARAAELRAIHGKPPQGFREQLFDLYARRRARRRSAVTSA